MPRTHQKLGSSKIFSEFFYKDKGIFSELCGRQQSNRDAIGSRKDHFEHWHGLVESGSVATRGMMWLGTRQDPKGRWPFNGAKAYGRNEAHQPATTAPQQLLQARPNPLSFYQRSQAWNGETLDRVALSVHSPVATKLSNSVIKKKTLQLQ